MNEARWNNMLANRAKKSPSEQKSIISDFVNSIREERKRINEQARNNRIKAGLDKPAQTPSASKPNSQKPSLDLNEGMAEYLKANPTETTSKLVESTDLFDGNNTPKETATRNEEREAASAIFNGGKKKAPARQAKPIERESAPVIDFEMLANRGYAEPTMREMPGEGIVNPTPTEQPKQRLGKDLLYSKARERSADELAEQKPMVEPKTPSSDEMWASFDDDTKAKILASYEANNK